MPHVSSIPDLDYSSDTYREAYSRINAIVIEGERHAHDNFVRISELLPDHQTELMRLARMEARHRKSFIACGRNLDVTPDMDFAHQFFADLHQRFQQAADAGQIATCLVIQALVIECFAIAAYNSYIPVADAFARKITEAVVKDEFSHLSFGEIWLQQTFEQNRDEIDAANRQIMPIIWRMLQQVESDMHRVGMSKATVIADFMTRYGDTLSQIGFNVREVLRMSAYSLQSGAR